MPKTLDVLLAMSNKALERYATTPPASKLAFPLL